MKAVGTHNLEGISGAEFDYLKDNGYIWMDRTFKYYRCAECGMIAFETKEGEFMISGVTKYNFAKNISCNEFIILEIIK